MFNEKERLTRGNQSILFHYLQSRGLDFKVTGNLACGWYGFHQHTPVVELIVPRCLGSSKAIRDYSISQGLEVDSLLEFYKASKEVPNIIIGNGIFNVKFVFDHKGTSFYDYTTIPVRISDNLKFKLLTRQSLLRYLKYSRGMGIARAFLALSYRRTDSDQKLLELYF